MKTAIIILSIILAILQYRLWFADDGLVKALHLKHTISTLQTKNAVAVKQNANLVNEINTLKKGGVAIENRARNDLGMIKKGEVFYQVVR